MQVTQLYNDYYFQALLFTVYVLYVLLSPLPALQGIFLVSP